MSLGHQAKKPKSFSGSSMKPQKVSHARYNKRAGGGVYFRKKRGK